MVHETSSSTPKGHRPIDKLEKAVEDGWETYNDSDDETIKDLALEDALDALLQLRKARRNRKKVAKRSAPALPDID